MKQYIVVTIDVEPDCSPNWIYSSPLTFAGVSSGIKDLLHPLFLKYNVIPTYLINNVVLEDNASVGTLRSLGGKYELGTHLHPEFIEPQKRFADYAGKKGEANCCFYAPEIEFKKIENITKLFDQQFGYLPTSFRAGRFSAGSNTVKSLKKLGYKVDTSITPTVRWKDKSREQAVDFRHINNQPFWINERMEVDATSNSLLEVPVSIIKRKLSFSKYIKQNVYQHRSPLHLSESVWLRPVFSGLEGFKTVIREIKDGHQGEQSLVYNMMFHNVEVMPGLSPYTQTDADSKRYLCLLERFFEYSNASNFTSIELSGLYDVYQ